MNNCQYLKKLLRLFFFCICLFIIFNYFRNNHAELSLIFNISPQNTARLSVINILIHITVGLQFYYFLKWLKIKPINLIDWYDIFSISRLINLHVTQGGNLYRGVQLKKNYNFSYTRTLILISLFSWFQIILSLALAAGVLLLYPLNIYLYGVHLSWYLCILSILLYSAPFAGNILVNKIFPDKEKYKGLGAKFDEFLSSFYDTIKKPGIIFVMLFFNLVIFFFTVLQIHYAFKAIHINLNFGESTLFSAVSLLSALINITPANLGVTELVYGSLNKFLGNSLGEGVIASGILRVINYFVLIFSILFCRLVIFLRKK